MMTATLTCEQSVNILCLLRARHGRHVVVVGPARVVVEPVLCPGHGVGVAGGHVEGLAGGNVVETFVDGDVGTAWAVGGRYQWKH